MDRAWKIYRGIYAGAVNQIETWLDDDTADRYSVLRRSTPYGSNISDLEDHDHFLFVLSFDGFLLERLLRTPEEPQKEN